MSLEIEWLEPPLSTETRVKEALKNNPGKWARVKKNMASPTSRSAWRKEGFEAESHPSTDNKARYDIYARWPATPTQASPTAPAVPYAPGKTSVIPAGKPAIKTDVNGLPIRQGAIEPKPAAGGPYKYRGHDSDHQ